MATIGATCIIKKVFVLKREPYGFLRVLTPIEHRGEEASFFFTDVQDPEARKCLNSGMIVECKLADKPEDHMKSFAKFRACQITPVDPAEYRACVVRPPSPQGAGFIVALDLTLTRVKISSKSFLSLGHKKPVRQEDVCIVRLSWSEQIRSSKEEIPIGEIVSFENTQTLEEEKEDEEAQSDDQEETIIGKADPLFRDEQVEDKIFSDDEKPLHEAFKDMNIERAAFGFPKIHLHSTPLPSGNRCSEKYNFELNKSQMSNCQQKGIPPFTNCICAMPSCCLNRVPGPCCLGLHMRNRLV